MHARRVQVASVLFAAAVLACGPTKKGTGGGGGGDVGVRTATQPGNPVARTVSVTISEAGGTLASADGTLAITVPAGALDSSTDLTITPITNTAHGAVGGAFRLGPEGTTFAIPVLLTFKAPDKYPSGTSIAGVGIEVQDKAGFWHRLDGVTRSANAKTVSVTTDHFSDWAVTWQTSTAAAEGPIKLIQTVDVPFTAFGRASVFVLSDDATDTSYLLTGTLTVPETITVGDQTCVPDSTTKALPLSIAELHKPYPPVFRWGIATTWSLSCTDPGGAVTTRLMPAMFDTLNINLTRCGGYYEAGQTADSAHLQGAYTKNCGVDGYVNATWDLRSCVPDVACQVPTECHTGVTTCTDGVAACVDSGVADNGTACGALTGSEVCSEGQCVDLNDQAIGITVAPTGTLTTSEAGGTATFWLVLNKQPTTTVTIGLSSSRTAEGTVSPSSVTFTPQDWNVAQPVTVTGQDDLVADDDQTFTVVTAPAVSADPRYGGLDAGDVQVSNLDNDVPGFVLSATSGLVTSEAGGQATFTVALSSQPTADVSVDLSTSAATEGTVAAPATVTFTPSSWNQPQVVTVTGVDDFVADGSVKYSVLGVARSADGKYQGRAMPSVEVTNDDNDSAGISPSVTAGLTTTEAAGGTATFTVTLHSQPTAEVTLPLRSTNVFEGTVSPPALVFTADDWNQPHVVTVTGVDDLVAEDPQTYQIVSDKALSADPGYADLLMPAVEVTNLSDDVASISVDPVAGLQTTEGGGQATFTVVLTSRPTANVTVPLTSGDANEGTVAPAELTFTPDDWSTPQTVTVKGVDDFVVDGPKVWFARTLPAVSDDGKYSGINAQDVEVTNADDDTAGIDVTGTTGLRTTEAGGEVSFSVVLRSQPTSDVVIPLASTNTAEGTVSAAALTFTSANWSTAQLVTVHGVGDAVMDGDKGYAIQLGPAQSADASYSGRTLADVPVTNTDDDQAGVTVSAPSSAFTTEAGGPSTFTVVLRSQPTAGVTVTFASSVAAEGTVVPPAALAFDSGNWNVPQTVKVAGVNDDVVDGNKPYQVLGTVTSGDPNYEGKPVAPVDLVNDDDDQVGIVVTAAAGLQTRETGGAQATFTVRLASQPTSNVTVPLASTRTSEGTVSPPELVFTSANWNAPQVVTVTGVNDDVVDGNQDYAISIGPASGGGYAGVTAPAVQVTNVDDDVAAVVVTPPASPFTSETGVSTTFTVAITTQPTSTVTIALTSSDPGEGTVFPETLTFTPADWQVGRTVTVTGVDDDVVDPDEPYTISAVASGDTAYAGISIASVALTNQDNDVAAIVVDAAPGLTTSEASGTATFSVRLATRPATTVTVPIASRNTAEGTVSTAALVFTSENWNASQSVTVQGVDDLVDDGDRAYAIAIGPADAADPAYAGVSASDVPVTNTDDDTAGLVVSPAGGLVTSEDGGFAQLTVKLSSRPLSPVTVSVVSDNAFEGVAAPDTLVFDDTNWNVAQAVTVTGVDDPVVDGNVGYGVTVSAASADTRYAGLSPVVVGLTNADDDSAGLVVLGAQGLQTSEAGGSPTTFSVQLRSRPSGNVTVSVSSSQTAEGTVLPAELTFTPDDWDTPRTISVTGADDDVVDGAQPYSIDLGPASSSDANYAGAIASVPVTNLDDDQAGVAVAFLTPPTTTKTGGVAQFTVVLASQPIGDVTLTVSSATTNPVQGKLLLADGTTHADSMPLTFTSLSWGTPQTVTVVGQDDATVGSVAYDVTLTPDPASDAAYAGLVIPAVHLTNEDGVGAVAAVP